MLLFAAVAPLFAQGIVPSGLTSLTTELVNIFTGPIVRAILICCLAACGVAYGFNKDNEKMKRSIIAIGISIFIIIGAASIVDALISASK